MVMVVIVGDILPIGWWGIFSTSARVASPVYGYGLD